MLDAARFEMHPVLADRTSVSCVSWSPDGMKIVIGLYDGTIRIFSMSSGVLHFTNCVKVGDCNAAVNCVAWSPDGTKIATGSADSVVVIFDVLTLLPGFSLSRWLEPSQLSFELGGGVAAVTWHPSSSRIAAASVYRPELEIEPPDDATWERLGRGHFLHIFSLADGSEDARFQHTDQIGSIAWNPQGGLIATAACDDMVRLFDPSAPVERILCECPRAWNVAWNLAGTLLAVTCHDAIRLFYLTEDPLVVMDQIPVSKPFCILGERDVLDEEDESADDDIGWTSVAWSPHGSLIAATCLGYGMLNSRTCVFNVAAEAQVAEYGVRCDVNDLAWCPRLCNSTDALLRKHAE